jgi:hypothetical protein
MVPLVKTIVAFRHLHPLVKVDFPPFVNYFHPEMDLILDREAFISTLTHFPHLSSSDPSSMVYQLLWDCFVPDDFANGFVFFFRYASMSFVVMFLHQYHVYLLHHDYYLQKNIQSIMIKKVIYQLITRIFAI